MIGSTTHKLFNSTTPGYKVDLYTVDGMFVKQFTKIGDAKKWFRDQRKQHKSWVMEKVNRSYCSDVPPEEVAVIRKKQKNDKFKVVKQSINSPFILKVKIRNNKWETKWSHPDWDVVAAWLKSVGNVNPYEIDVVKR